MAGRLSHAKSQLTQLFQHIMAWVQQAISNSKEWSRALTISTILEIISLVDARIDAFEEWVQKRLSEAQSSDLSAVQSEIEKLRVDMTSSLVAPVIV